MVDSRIVVHSTIGLEAQDAPCVGDGIVEGGNLAASLPVRRPTRSRRIPMGPSVLLCIGLAPAQAGDAEPGDPRPIPPAPVPSPPGRPIPPSPVPPPHPEPIPPAPIR